MKRSALIVACALLSVARTEAQSSSKRSPFLPPDRQVAAPVAENTPIEFRGMLVMDGQRRFNFFEPTKRISTWTGLNESGAAVTVKSFDATAETVVVEFAGRTMTLELRKMKVASAPLSPGPVAMPTGPASTTPVEQPAVVLNPTAADEAKRLDSIAAEVRRRRLLRQQAAPTVGQPKQN